MDQKEFSEKMKKADKKVKKNRIHDVCLESIMWSKALGETGSRQLYICVEEMAELTQCIQKALRGKTDLTNMTEEIADVYIGLDYLKQVIGISDEDVNKAINVKLDRLHERVAQAKKKGEPFL